LLVFIVKQCDGSHHRFLSALGEGHSLPVHDSCPSCHFFYTALFSIEKSIEQSADEQTAAQWWKTTRTIIRNITTRMRRVLTAMSKRTFL
jgi:hypothetical protein